MPVVNRTNNQVLPSNMRAVDVAVQAVQEITPAQQRRAHNAFMVQGFPGIYYSKARGAPNCSCVSERRVVNSILDEQGKASAGVINELLTGGSFGVSAYGPSKDGRTRIAEDKELQAFIVSDPSIAHSVVSPQQGSPFDLASGMDALQEGTDLTGRIPLGPDFGDGGPQGFMDIDEMVGSFDLGAAGFGDHACPVCFGSGIVGGYNPMFGTRIVRAAHQLGLQAPGHDPGILQVEGRPWSALTSSAVLITTLPKGATSVTSVSAWSSSTILPFVLAINGKPVKSRSELLAWATGEPVVLVFEFDTEVELTHVELQFVLSTESVYLEFPKMNKGSDLQYLDTTDPFQLLLSPNIPVVQQEDLITDSVYGKTWMVQSVSPHQTRNSQQLGWEAQVRVVQPQEVGTLLPKLYRVPQKERTTRMVRDNMGGHRRT